MQVTPALLLGFGVVVGAMILRENRAGAVPDKIVPTIVAQFDTIDIPVPTRFIPIGTKVSAIEFKKVAFPRHQVPHGALISVENFLNATAITPLPANLPLFEQNLSLSAAASNPVVERIPAGMRAMTIKVDATSAVEGWAGSGSIVDVLLIEKSRTSVVAEKVQILSAERSVSPVDGGVSPQIPSTVTLLVTQEQCLAINTAVPLGRIAFALRNAGDDSSWSDISYTAERLKGAPSSPRGAATINGYIALQDEKGARQRYALSEGRWIRTEVVPEGFFATRERTEQ